MDGPSAMPPLVRPSDCAPDRPALIVTGRPDGRHGRPSPFAAVTWRLIPDRIRSADSPRRPYAGA